ncbi:hypothetical protein DKX38_001622 [Salix brachista]|uniref:Uncharacterized protein n=1 Tax=Salix brachista TaxID=2182728 RepID=A0A5N5P5B2_9ROSI|nr:hypothetical protein DKX38_001622 [Salix brachista]
MRHYLEKTKILAKNAVVILKGKNVLTDSKCTARVHSKDRDMINSNSTVYTAANQSDNSVAADGAEGKEEEVSFSHRCRWIGRLGENRKSDASARYLGMLKDSVLSRFAGQPHRVAYLAGD